MSLKREVIKCVQGRTKFLEKEAFSLDSKALGSKVCGVDSRFQALDFVVLHGLGSGVYGLGFRVLAIALAFKLNTQGSGLWNLNLWLYILNSRFRPLGFKFSIILPGIFLKKTLQLRTSNLELRFWSLELIF